ncbi:MAG: hypothetical protein MMC23_004858 [Stictis urceolatum]|nr:hypothetical protein [Stictis urceolata]
MRILPTTSTLLLATHASAQGATITSICQEVTVGEWCPITWTGDGSPVTITLLNGPATNLQPVRNVTENDPCNGTLSDSFNWLPRLSLSAAATGYALQITQSGLSTCTSKFDVDTTIAHAPPTADPVTLNASSGELQGGWDDLSAGTDFGGGSGSGMATGTDGSGGWGTGFGTGAMNGSASAMYPNASTTGVEVTAVPTGGYSVVGTGWGPSNTALGSSNTGGFASSNTGLFPSSNSSAGAGLSYSMQETTAVSTTSMTDDTPSIGFTATNTPPSPTVPPLVRSSSSSDLGSVPTHGAELGWALMGCIGFAGLL